MRRLRLTCAVITVALAALSAQMTVGAEKSGQKASGSSVRVGTFDSRAVAIAFYRSADFNLQMKDLRAEHEKAKASGDEERVREFEVEGATLQGLMHKQGFSTWPVDDILERIEGEIPEIAAKAEVDVVVSKWDVVYQRSGVEFVDVTELMVKPFSPDKETRTILEGIQQQDPVPLEELEGHQD